MAKRRKELPLPPPAIVAVATSLLCANSAHANDLAAIRLVAERNIVKADGRSTTIINAQVFDSRGNAAADGTQVRFTTDNGRLETAVVSTRNGVARVTLTASDQPGEAHIVAVLESGQSAPARITISFRQDVDNTQVEDDWVRIDGPQYCGYVKDFNVIQANGKNGDASFSYRSLNVQAETIQYNLKNGLLRASGKVVVRTNGQERRYDNLRFSLTAGDGIAERIEENKPVAFILSGIHLTENPWPPGRFLPSKIMWEMDDLSGASITIVSRSVALARDGQMQFRRATFYVDGRKTFSVPFHVMSQHQDSIYQEQIIGLGAQGITIDFPYYYDVRPNAIGTVFLRHGAQLSQSAFSNRPGWWLDVAQNYNGKNQTNGALELLGITRPDWGARWRHGQRLDRTTTASVFMDFPYHRDLFVTSQLSKNFRDFLTNISLSGSRAKGFVDPITGEAGQIGGDIRGQIFAETYDKPVPSLAKIRYAFNATLSRQSSFGNGNTTRGAITSETIGTRFYNVPQPIAPKTTLVQSVIMGQTWVQGSTNGTSASRSGLTLLGTTTVRHDFNPGNSLALTYDYTQSPITLNSINAQGNAQHRLGFTAILGSGSNWNLFLTGSQGLDQQQTSLNGGLQFSLGGPWRGAIQYYASNIDNVRYQEVQYTLIRNIIGRQFAIHYSTTSGRFQLDFSGARF